MFGPNNFGRDSFDSYWNRKQICSLIKFVLHMKIIHKNNHFGQVWKRKS
jgi:hypothetical protein